MGQIAKTNEAMCELELKDVRKYKKNRLSSITNVAPGGSANQIAVFTSN
jgi:hypothetical protein